jgi:hypothetical protein
VGRARKQRGGIDVQAACAAGPAREDVVGVPHLVPGAALADAQLDHDPIRLNRIMISSLFFGKPVRTFPDHALGQKKTAADIQKEA